MFGWQALRGGRGSAVPCLLDLPSRHYTTSGRAAILLALEALGVGPGSAVLLPSYHCPTMVAPAVHLGATPHFFPIDERGAPDLAWLGGQDLRRAKVMLAAHYFGLPQPMATVRHWCHERGIALVEDCAHALFGRSGGKSIGAWGDFAIGSLPKFLPVPEGGCLVVNRAVALPALQRRGMAAGTKAAVDMLDVGAAHGRLAGLNTLIAVGLAGLRRLRTRSSAAAGAASSATAEAAPPAGADFVIDPRQAHRDLARPCRWAAQHLPRARIVDLRRRNYGMLLHRLGGYSGLRPLMPELPPDCAPYVFPLWVDRPDPSYAELRRLGMPVYRWDRVWPGMPHLPADQGALWSHHVLQLACHQDLRQEQLDRLVETMLRLYAT